MTVFKKRICAVMYVGCRDIQPCSRTLFRFARYSCTPYSLKTIALRLASRGAGRVEFERLAVVGHRELEVVLLEEAVTAVHVQIELALLALDRFVEQDDRFFVEA